MREKLIAATLTTFIFSVPGTSLGHDLNADGTQIGSAPLLPERSVAPTGALQGLVDTAKIWEVKTPITVCFLDGNSNSKAFFVDLAKSWLSSAHGLIVDFGSSPNFYNCTSQNGDIRVSFSGSGDWSYVGRDATLIAPGKPTLNLSTLRGGLTPRTKAIATGNTLHEFGHALGAEHEHQRSEFATCLAQLDLVRVKQETGWDDDKVQANITGILKGRGETTYDPYSVMNYQFPATWFKSGSDSSCLRERRLELSQGDKNLIAHLYPNTEVEQNAFLQELKARAVSAAESLDETQKKRFQTAFNEALPSNFRRNNGGVKLTITEGVQNSGRLNVTATGGSVAVGVARDIDVTLGEQRPDQPENVEIVVTPLVRASRVVRRPVTQPRAGISTGDLTRKKCRSYSYGPASGWAIDPTTLTFVSLVTKAWSRQRFTQRSPDGVTAEFCAKSQISGLKKKTGDSFGSVHYFETKTVTEDRPTTPVTVILRPPNTSSTIQVPENAISFTALIKEAGKQDVQASEGRVGNYLLSLDSVSKFLTIQWAPQ